jgi:hypothetical protein
MVPLTVYVTGRPWWRRRWQGEPTDQSIDCCCWSKAVTAFTERGAWRKTLRRYKRCRYWAMRKSWEA